MVQPEVHKQNPLAGVTRFIAVAAPVLWRVPCSS